MDLKYRNLIRKCKPVHKLLRWIAYNSGFFFYFKLSRKNNYKTYFSSIKESKKGKRCFIIGNGPSLNAKDLDKLVNEDTFGVNEIHRLFSKTLWRPTYYIIIDRYSKSSPEEIAKVECKQCFLGSYYWRYNNVWL